MRRQRRVYDIRTAEHEETEGNNLRVEVQLSRLFLFISYRPADLFSILLTLVNLNQLKTVDQ